MAAKKVAKKAAKKTAKKVAKKAPAKKAAKKAVKRVAKKAAASYTVPPVPTRGTSTKRISSVTPSSKTSTETPVKSAPAKSKSSSRTVVTIIAAIILIALLVVSKNSTKSNTSSTSTDATASQSAAPATQEAMASESAQASPASPQAPSAGHGAPQGIVAHYNAKGATIYWAAPAEANGISNYQVEINQNGGAFKVASTVPASQLSMDIAKSDANGWSSFRISTVYSDGTVVGGKVFGLPGQWS